MKRSPIILLVAALGLVLAGCGGDGNGSDDAAAGENRSTATTAAAGATSGGDTITVEAREFSYEPAELRLEAGKPTTIVLKNVGAIEHDITIDDRAFKVAANPTKTAEATLTMPSAGSYTFYCSVPGHREAGMEGPVTVS